MLRMALPEEREALKALWQLCFNEEAGFLDWFFRDRFLPEYCAVDVRDGRIAACVHTLPGYMRVRESILPCAIIAGVSTHPDFRGMGLMHGVMAYLLRTLRQRGVALFPHRPAKLTTFFSLGHYPVSDSLYVTAAGAQAQDPCETADLREDLSALYVCYTRFAGRYSGMIARSYADFALKCADYRSGDARCVLLREAGAVQGYCIYFDTADGLFGEECAACDPNAYEALYRSLLARAAGKEIKLRLPADASLIAAGAQREILPRSVLGVGNAAELLRAVGLRGGALEVTDAVVPENAGVYDLSGARTAAQPQLRISAGRLAQWAVGYRSMAEIVAAGEAEALDAGILETMDAAGKCPCFIVDEY